MAGYRRASRRDVTPSLVTVFPHDGGGEKFSDRWFSQKTEFPDGMDRAGSLAFHGATPALVAIIAALSIPA